MGNWSQQQEYKKEVKERDKSRRENLAKYFFDVSKITYTILVIGVMVSFFQYKQYENYSMIVLVFVGIILAFVFAKVGNNILK